MRRFGPEIAILLLWAIALFATTRALAAAGATLTGVAPVFAMCAAGCIVVLGVARRSASTRSP